MEARLLLYATTLLFLQTTPIWSADTDPGQLNEADLVNILMSLSPTTKKRKSSPNTSEQTAAEPQTKRRKTEQPEQPLLDPWTNQPPTATTLNTIAQHLETTLRRNIPTMSKNEITALQQEQLDIIAEDEKGTSSKRLEKGIIRQITIPDDARLFLIGDIHGDYGPIEALINLLEEKKLFNKETFTITDPLVFIVFLGDYIDRGPDSLRVLWELTRLHEKNSSNVILLRGNHETEIHELDLCVTDTEDEADFLPIYNAFSLLPVVVFIDRATDATKSLALLHGGIDTTLRTSLRLRPLEKNYAYILPAHAHAYLWHDLKNNQETKPSAKKHGRAKLNKHEVLSWMKLNNIACIFRGHQQQNSLYTDENNHTYLLFSEGPTIGVASHWNDAVITLNVAPNTEVLNTNFAGIFYDTAGTFLSLKKCRTRETEEGEEECLPESATRKLQSLPGYAIKPYYFDPETHEAIDRCLIPQSTSDYSSSASETIEKISYKPTYLNAAAQPALAVIDGQEEQSLEQLGRTNLQ